MVSRHPDGRISEETSRTHVVLKQRLGQRQRRVGTMIAAKSQGSENSVVGGEAAVYSTSVKHGKKD